MDVMAPPTGALERVPSPSFFVHHTQQLALAAILGDAKAIRRETTINSISTAEVLTLVDAKSRVFRRGLWPARSAPACGATVAETTIGGQVKDHLYWYLNGLHATVPAYMHPDSRHHEHGPFHDSPRFTRGMGQVCLRAKLLEPTSEPRLLRPAPTSPHARRFSAAAARPLRPDPADGGPAPARQRRSAAAASGAPGRASAAGLPGHRERVGWTRLGSWVIGGALGDLSDQVRASSPNGPVQGERLWKRQ